MCNNILHYVIHYTSDGWEDLTLEYNRQLPLELSRDMESLRNKFKGLRNKKKSTGDPTCPPEVVRAKRAQREIEKRQSVEEFDGSSSSSDEDDDSVHAEVLITKRAARLLLRTAVEPVPPPGGSAIMNSGYSSRGSSPSPSFLGTKRQKIDFFIDTTGDPNNRLIELHKAEMEERRIERIEREERRREERLEREQLRRIEKEEREEQRREDRAKREEQQRRDDRNMMLMLAALTGGKLSNFLPDGN
mmetsp:Transcript_17369/g.25901  ORF Transcript_17369/g.25901 Transcript_17369/m.25901 type:complete len:246 (+) Transcript_17369:309-1046(+)